jgi:IclR family transcriptional regulator, acetate operon repressor
MEDDMSTISKALAVLNTLAVMETEPGLTEIARATSLDKATARRMLVELERDGFVEQDSVTKRYRLGNAPVRLAHIRQRRYPFVDVAKPFLKSLAERTGETVHLSQAVGGQLATMHVENSPQAHRINVNVGALLPFHATASGLAYLAVMSPSARSAHIAGGLPGFTSRTLTDVAALEQVIAETVERGFSSSIGGFEDGVASVAVAILDIHGTLMATLAIAAPKIRTSEEKMQSFGLMAVETARDIARAYWGTKRSAAQK